MTTTTETCAVCGRHHNAYLPCMSAQRIADMPAVENVTSAELVLALLAIPERPLGVDLYKIADALLAQFDITHKATT